VTSSDRIGGRAGAVRRLAERIATGGSGGGPARITVLTGAGVSVASGVPTFRGEGGLWRSWRAEDLATPQAFARDPKLVWEWYAWRRGLIAACDPNPAHEVLSGWSRRYPGFTLITQNVDGLHERAGTENVVRFHGSIWDVGCWDDCPGSPHRWEDRRHPLPEVPLTCPYCGGLARPGVVWFGEGIDPAVLEASAHAVHCDLFLTVGTSAVVYPAAGLVAGASARGAFTAEVNPQATAASTEVDLALQGPAEEVLPEVEAALEAGA
jgi:NAD-dependent deacetylase